MKQQRLTGQLVEMKIEKVFDTFRKAADRFWKGHITRDECERVMREEFFTVFLQLFSDNDLKLCLNKTNYPQFVREFETFQKKENPADSNHIPWLYDVSDTPCEANENDQKQFLYLMETFHVTPDYFAPVPDRIPDPGIVPIHPYRFPIYGIHFNCIDDGGLLSDSSPVGKTFKLKNEFGLTAVLTIKEDRRYIDRSGMDFDEIACYSNGLSCIVKADFLSEGCIEGYTACEGRESPEILIRLKDKGSKVYWLAYKEDRNDCRVRREYPLWQEYYNWTQEKDLKLSAILAEFL